MITPFAVSNWRSLSGLPMQPIVKDEKGVPRFRANALVRFLLENGPHNLNHLAKLHFPREDYEQFDQLIGYSVSGISDHDFVSKELVQAADEAVEQLRVTPIKPDKLRPILMGNAEILDEPPEGEQDDKSPTFPKAVPDLMSKDGFYIAVDLENADYQVPLAVQDGKLYSLKVDREISPMELKKTIVYSGPYTNEKGDDAILMRRLQRLLDQAVASADTVGQLALEDAMEIIRQR